MDIYEGYIPTPAVNLYRTQEKKNFLHSNDTGAGLVVIPKGAEIVICLNYPIEATATD